MAGPYPLATIACTIGPDGISSPTLEDIIQSGLAQAAIIFGSDIYVPEGSQDYQDIVARAQAQYDTNMANIAAYNNMSPKTAFGVGLSNDVKVNGLRREAATNSTLIVQLGGTAGTLIPAGLIKDSNGNTWSIPANTIIDPVTATVTVTATCQEPGAITLPQNSLTADNIFTPVLGWQTLTNSTAAATPGAPVETDAQLRQRQSQSTSNQARTQLQAIQGNIENLAGVTACKVYQNDGNAPDGNGIPGHTLCAVVAGGDATQIAQTIEIYKDGGCGTYGSTSVTVTDPGGLPITIRFQPLAEVPIFFAIGITSLAGYVSSTGDALIAALVAFINSLPIGTSVYQAWALAVASLPGPLQDTFVVNTLYLGLAANPTTIATIPITFSQQATTAAGNIALTVT